MANSSLSDLLKEYEHKRYVAELDLEKRKRDLYAMIPRFEEIEKEINMLGFKTAASILTGTAKTKAFDKKLSELKREKKALLKEHGYNSSYLEPNYECKICKDTGYVGTSGEMCSCLKQRLLDLSYLNSNIANLSKENFANFNEKVFSNKVDKDAYGCAVSPRENILDIKAKCIKFIDEFDNPDTKNLFFTGNIGLGKTYMSSCIAGEMIKKGKTVLYQTAPILLDSVIDYKFSNNKNVTENIYKDVLEADLLIIDDFGADSINSAKYDVLFDVINSRILGVHGKAVKTIISTNLDIVDIFNFDERIGSRIAGYYDIFRFFGEDIRMKR